MTINRLNRDTFNLGLREVVYFTSSGTFTKASYPWLRAIKVKVQGGGGGGGGASATTAGQLSIGGAGGGGAYAESFITNIVGLDASITVTRGAGGTGGTAGNNNGTAGGASSFGALVSANGGNFGEGRIAQSASAGNSGPSGFLQSTATGNLVVAGSGGVPRIFTYTGDPLRASAPSGGGSFLGGFGDARNTNGNGFSNNSLGGGASGGFNAESQVTDRTGGNGGNGIVIVELYA
jgi:hypothetical protein